MHKKIIKCHCTVVLENKSNLSLKVKCKTFNKYSLLGYQKLNYKCHIFTFEGFKVLLLYNKIMCQN